MLKATLYCAVAALFATAALAQKSKCEPVSSVAQFDRVIELAARDSGASGKVIDITCDDSDESVEFCANDFADTCVAHGGGLSTNPDGTITCSVLMAAFEPDDLAVVEVRNQREFDEALSTRGKGVRGAALVTTCSPGNSRWCTSGGFAKACDGAGGGMSTNPDGSVSCHVP